MKKTLLTLLILLNLTIISKSETLSLEKNTKFFFNNKKQQQKDWNFLVYINSNNNLNPFSELNINQMKQVGSNKHVNILVQDDVYGKKESRRYYIKKNRKKLIQKVTQGPEAISGTPKSLYNFVEWGIKNYPAKHNALILWDHGSGIIDPEIWKRFFELNPLKLYKLNIETGLYELNREFLNKRGICFNEIFEVYLTNQKLKETLNKINSELLKGRKIDLLGMDACNMAMLEVGAQIKDSVKYLVASEEVEPGTGWNYQAALSPFLQKTLTAEELSKNIVQAYQLNYEKTHQDFTQSAINLEKITELETNLNEISKNLININTENRLFINKINRIRNNQTQTTSFANPDYIDLGHFYINLNKLAIKTINTEQNKKTKDSLNEIEKLTNAGIILINDIVIEKTFCPSLALAEGLAFYFPRRKIHNSYKITDFAINNNWLNFLKEYIK
jgi:hypothetical protein